MSIRFNAILNVIRQGINIAFPLITYPYALRVLGVEGIGKVNYSRSIVSYLCLIAMLGITSYSVREGAKLRKKKESFDTFISEVFSINLISTIISYVLLIGAITLVGKLKDYRWLILLQSISIVFTTLGIDYVNVIEEDFLIITIRSIVLRIISLALLFILVRTPNDYYWYALLHVITDGLVCLSNTFYCRRYVRIRFRIGRCLLPHIKPMLILFANTVAISIYVNIDTTMLGWLKGDYYVGLYAASVKLYDVLKSLLAATYLVTIPQLAAAYGDKNFQKYKTIVADLVSCIFLLLIPTGTGLICLAPEIMLFIGGGKYTGAILSLQILAGSLIFAILGGIVTVCINITMGREKDNLRATTLSAALNFLLNLYFIPRYNLYGAAFTTLISEAFVLIFCFVRIPNKSMLFDFQKICKTIIHSCIGIGIVVSSNICIKMTLENSIARMICVFLTSVVAYMLALLLVKDVYASEAWHTLKKRVKKVFAVFSVQE